MNINKKWKIFLIHHSHTDIGYTERQDKIINYHADFIKQAIDILNDIHHKGRKEYEGFVWQCENFWQVQTFYAQASKEYIDDFEKYVKSGEIGLSGNYLNMTELVGYDVLESRIAKAKVYAEDINYPITSGMSADINGFAWGYVDALYENGIENFLSCLHPHHGMFPLFKKVMPFYWESPKGNKVLMWNGEHYHFGNEMHLAPYAGETYMIHDEISKKIQSGLIHKKDASDTEAVEMAFLEERMERFLQNMEIEGYGYDFVPVMVSGAFTDNAPPSREIAKRVNRLNEKFAEQISFEMVTLEQFFAYVRAHCTDIPCYKGDWNDWWADGVGSTPAPVKVFKDAQRKYNLCKKLNADNLLGDSKLVEKAAENMMLYAEHTWGYSSSVSEPWETLVGDLELKKTGYAIQANTYISQNLDRILAEKGEVSIKCQKPQRFKVVNPHVFEVRTKANLYVEFWEYLDGTKFSIDTPFEVVDAKTEEVLVSQIVRIARAYQIEIMITLEAGEEREVYLRHTHKAQNETIKNYPYIGAEGIQDIVQPNCYEENTSKVETDDFVITFNQERGIEGIIDKKTNKNIVRSPYEVTPFAGIYEVTDAIGGACETRRRMGRNRKAESTRRYVSKLRDIHMVENGEVFITMQLDYQLEGTKMYSVILKIYKQMARMDVMIRLHKESVWEPENLYVALPFTTGEQEQNYLDKTGCVIRPGIDQLLGTNKEFYLLQNGIIVQGKTRSVTIAIKDAPLVTFGDLRAKPIRLCTGKDYEYNQEVPYSWIMNNYWETNFKVDLGGFYEFAYTISVRDVAEIHSAFKKCEADNEGLVAFYI